MLASVWCKALSDRLMGNKVGRNGLQEVVRQCLGAREADGAVSGRRLDGTRRVGADEEVDDGEVDEDGGMGPKKSKSTDQPTKLIWGCGYRMPAPPSFVLADSAPCRLGYVEGHFSSRKSHATSQLKDFPRHRLWSGPSGNVKCG
jgi:hypothetical protein